MRYSTVFLALACPVSALFARCSPYRNACNVSGTYHEANLSVGSIEGLKLRHRRTDRGKKEHYEARIRQAGDPTDAVPEGSINLSDDEVAGVTHVISDDGSWSGARISDEAISGVQGEIVVPHLFSTHASHDGLSGGQAWFGIDGSSKNCGLSVRAGVGWELSKYKTPKIVAFVDLGSTRIHEFDLPINPTDCVEIKITSIIGIGLKISAKNKTHRLSAEWSFESLLEDMLGERICKRLISEAQMKSKELKDVIERELCKISVDRMICLEFAEWMVSRAVDKTFSGGEKLLKMAKYKGLKFKDMAYTTRKGKDKKFRISKPKMFKHEEGFFQNDVSTCKLHRGKKEMECRFGKFSGRHS